MELRFPNQADLIGTAPEHNTSHAGTLTRWLQESNQLNSADKLGELQGHHQNTVSRYQLPGRSTYSLRSLTPPTNSGNSRNLKMMTPW